MIQLQILNKLLQNKDTSILMMNNITDEFFCDYKDEFNFIQTHLTKYGTPPDTTTFATKFPDFTFITVTESNKYLIDALYEDRNKRKLAETFNKVKSLVTSGKTDEALKLFTNSANDMVKGTAIESIDITKDTSRYDRYVERISNFNMYYVKTGFPELDACIGGWDRLEELGTVVARPGVGKSWVLLKIAMAAVEQGLNVGIYSGEMSENKVGYRFDTLVSHISNGGIMHGDIGVQADYQQYIKDLPNKFKGSLKVLTPRMVGGSVGVTALRAFIEKEKLDMLCIDQHSLLEDDRKGKTPPEKAANISKDLKLLQVREQIPIIAVSQQNRSATDDNGATTANVAASDRISQDSTQIIFLEQKDGILTLDLVKSRDSVNGKKLKYAIDLNKGLFTYIANENDALGGAGSEDLARQYDGPDGGEEF